ncbi:MAG TPA: nuclear transport factor 2 family protein [Gaiellaceae bacterium]|nr:nuclear transport factor 2 family protein [Gaiellaceae bacterium]
MATLRRLVDAFNRQDVEAALALFTEDAVFESSRGPDPWGRRYSGTKELREGIEGRFRAIPVGTYGEDTHAVLGDRGFSEWTLRGRTGDGEEIHIRGCDLWTFRGDRIARKCSFWKIVER